MSANVDVSLHNMSGMPLLPKAIYYVNIRLIRSDHKSSNNNLGTNPIHYTLIKQIPYQG